MTTAEEAIDQPLASDTSCTRARDQRSNYAAVLYGANDMRFEEAPELGTLEESYVRIQIKAVGICGTDVHFLKKGGGGPWTVKDPMVIGHEAAGVIIEVGPGVRAFRVGDRVALEPGSPCWTNRAARGGRYNLAADRKNLGLPPSHGALRNVMDYYEEFCFKLPDNVSYEEGAMCEPFSVGIHACRRGCVQPGKNVVILGAGPVGLLTLLAAKACGATRVLITDISTDNLALAESMGAYKTYCHSKTASPETLTKELKQMLSPIGPEVIIDCVGFESTMRTAVMSCAPGGKIVLVGLGQNQISVPMNTVTVRELEILGSFAYVNTYPLCLSLLADRTVDLKPLITHRLGFSEQEVAKGFDIAIRSAETKAIKVMFNL